MTTKEEYMPEPSGAVWTTKRTAPKGKAAEVGKLGTIANCLGGDDVWIYNKTKTRRYYATIAWTHRGGAMVRMNDGQKSEDLRFMPSSAQVEWRKVRPK